MDATARADVTSATTATKHPTLQSLILRPADVEKRFMAFPLVVATTDVISATSGSRPFGRVGVTHRQPLPERTYT